MNSAKAIEMFRTLPADEHPGGLAECAALVLAELDRLRAKVDKQAAELDRLRDQLDAIDTESRVWEIPPVPVDVDRVRDRYDHEWTPGPEGPLVWHCEELDLWFGWDELVRKRGALVEVASPAGHGVRALDDTAGHAAQRVEVERLRAIGARARTIAAAAGPGGQDQAIRTAALFILNGPAGTRGPDVDDQGGAPG